MADGVTDNEDIDELLQQLSDNAVAIAELREVIRQMIMREDDIVALSGGIDTSDHAPPGSSLLQNDRAVWAGAHPNRLAWARGTNSHNLEDGSPLHHLSNDIMDRVGERITRAPDPRGLVPPTCSRYSTSGNPSRPTIDGFTLPNRMHRRLAWARGTNPHHLEVGSPLHTVPDDIMGMIGERLPIPTPNQVLSVRRPACRTLAQTIPNLPHPQRAEALRSVHARLEHPTIARPSGHVPALRRLVEMGYPVREAAMALQLTGSRLTGCWTCGGSTHEQWFDATELLHAASGAEPGIAPTLAEASATRLFGEVNSDWKAVADAYEIAELRARDPDPEPEPDPGPGSGSDGGSRRTRTRRITKKKKSIKKKNSRKKKRSTKRR